MRNHLPLPRGYTLREAVVSDAEGIARVHFMSWKTSYRGIIEQGYLDAMVFEERLHHRRKIFEESTSIHLVALYGDTIIGFCDAHYLRFHSNQGLTLEQKEQRKELGEIYGIYLLEAHQGKRIGTALFEETRVQLKKRELIPFLLWTLKENFKARSFYEKQGGIIVDEISVKIGNQIYPEVAYRFEI